MKKLFILIAVLGIFGLASCSGNSSKSNEKAASQKVDSLVNKAKATAAKTTDSLTTDTKKATDSLKAAADSQKNSK